MSFIERTSNCLYLSLQASRRFLEGINVICPKHKCETHNCEIQRLFRCLGISAVLSLLCGCTINIYQHGDLEAGKTQRISFGEPTPGAQSQGKADVATTVARNGSVGAAEIMSISTTPNADRMRNGDTVALEVLLSVDAYVSCFYQQDDSNQIIKLFPNRLIAEYRLRSGQMLRVPGANGFRVLTNDFETKDSYMCLASSEDAMPNLPATFQANTFQRMPVGSFDDVYKIFRSSTEGNLVARVLDVPLRQ